MSSLWAQKRLKRLQHDRRWLKRDRTLKLNAEAIVIVLRLEESRPDILDTTRTKADYERLLNWTNSQPALRDIVRAALLATGRVHD